MDTTLDYPSYRRGGWGPPEPILLDTCTVQHLALVFELVDEHWTEESVAELRRRCSPTLATEIIALGDVLFYLTERGNGPIWGVSETSREELRRVGGPKGARLARWWQDLADYWEATLGEWPEELGLPEDDRPPPLQVSPFQLALPLAPVPVLPRPTAPIFGPFRDAGDRALILDAERGGFPSILTTDLRSLWRFRRWLYPRGIEVWRPSDFYEAIGGSRAGLAA